MGALLKKGKPFIRKEAGTSNWTIYRMTGRGDYWVWRGHSVRKACEKYKTTIGALQEAGLLWEVFP